MTLQTHDELRDGGAEPTLPVRERGMPDPGHVRTIGRRLGPGLALIVVVVAIAELVTRVLVHSDALAPPTSVLRALWTQLVGGDLGAALGDTLMDAGIALLIAIVAGVCTGVLLAVLPPLHSTLSPLIEFARPIPSVASIPFVILALGLGHATVITVTSYASYWPIVFGALYGIKHTDDVMLDTARNFGLRKTDIIWRVRLPGAATQIAAAIRTSTAIALLVAVGTELITGGDGVGFFIVHMQNALRYPELYAGVLSIGLAGLIVNVGARLLERRVVFWNAEFGRRGA